jgi:hypothetical protein
MGGFLGDHLLIFTSMGTTNMHKLAESYDNKKERAVEFGVVCGEHMRLACDRRTRSTGMLSRMVNVVDLEGISLGNLNTMMLGALGESGTLRYVI